MAMTTFATSLSLIEDKVLGTLISEYVVRPDPVAALIPMVTAPSMKFRQKLMSEPTGAQASRYDTAFAPSAFTEYEYEAFLTYLVKSDSRLKQMESAPVGDAGVSDRLTKKRVIIAALSKLYREYLLVGQPAGVTIGADLTTLGITAIEPGPRQCTFEDANGAAAVATSYGSFTWVNASKTLTYKAPGDTGYGTGVVLSATNFHRVPVYSANVGKWVYVTVVWATIGGAGNFASAGTDATCVKYTPSLQPTGLINQINPALRMFGNLSATNPTATGDALSQKNLTWLVGKLLDGSNGDASRCIVLCPENAWLACSVLVTGLGGGTSAVEFMGQRFNSLNFGGVPILKNAFVEDNRTAANTTTTGLCDVAGLVLGTDKAHVRYAAASDVVDNQLSDHSGNQVAVGDGTGSGASLPIQYFETMPGTSNLIYMVGDMTVEPVFGSIQSGAILTDVTQ
jgi:hypothetical protein